MLSPHGGASHGAIAAALVSGVVAVGAIMPPSGTWTREPDLIAPRAAHAVVATADAIYVFAGTGRDGTPVTDIERFDGNAWRRDATLPGEGLNAPAAAVVGNAIYLVGGFGTTTNRPTANVHRYDPRARTWSEAAALPAPRGGHAAVVLDGRIHVIGGGNSVSTIDDHTVFDPASNTWSERARLPRATGSPAAVVLAGRIYSIGGRSGPRDFGDVHIYDPAKDAWTPGPAIEPRGTSGAAVLGGAVYLFGGESQAAGAVLGSVLRLDAGANAWSPDAAMPTARSFARAVVFRGAIYTVGGSSGYGGGHSARGSAAVEAFRMKQQ